MILIKTWKGAILFFKIDLSIANVSQSLALWNLIGLYLFLSNVIWKITFARISLCNNVHKAYIAWRVGFLAKLWLRFLHVGQNFDVSLMHLCGSDSFQRGLFYTGSDEVNDDISPLKSNHLKSCKHPRASM